MTSTKIICEVIDGFKNKYSEEKTEPTDKIEEKEVVKFLIAVRAFIGHR